MLNPNTYIARSSGVDLPLMKVYLVGRIAGNVMDNCVSWRKKIIEHYKNYKFDLEIDNYVSYPISFQCPLNSGESKTADSLGLKSHLPATLIFDKDMLSLKNADLIIANLDDFMEVGIKDLMEIQETKVGDTRYNNVNFVESFFRLQDKIKNRRANYGSIFEVSVSLYLGKPVILISGNEKHKYILENHPFMSRCSIVVKDVDQLLKEKWLQTFYKSLAGSSGNYDL